MHNFKLILFIIIFIGCDSSDKINLVSYEDYNDTTTDTEWSTKYNCEDYYIRMGSYLYEDNNGYYLMEFVESDYSQTYTTLSVETGSVNFYQKVKFLSNKEIFLYNDWYNVINSDSYTDEYGIAKGAMGVWEKFIGDTIKVYSGYIDECNNQYIDSIEVIIN